MIAFPPCKINLGLYVTERREDGYHNVETCFYPVPFFDILEIIPADKTEFAVSGLSIPGPTDDNLCLKALHVLRKDFDISNVKMHLHKVVPTGAGLGGGSSDAAHTLRLLNMIFDLRLDNQTLRGYASRLGSDCAFFIEDQPMLGTGRGELLDPVRVDLGGKFLVMVKPDVHVSTVEAYAGISPKKMSGSLRTIIEQTPMTEWRDVLANDFEKSVFRKYPELESLKQELYDRGAVYAFMSGSGSTVAGLFNDAADVPDVRKVPVLWKGFLPSFSFAS